jgi:pimeloyl-ACP methyl ester carboxylesterase
MQTKQIQTNRGNWISYIEIGQGKPIVLLHGFVGSKTYWNYVIEPLAKQYRIIAPDLPGHGNSSATTNLASISDYAEEIADFIVKLQINSFSLFGHSLGGYITLAFAEKYANYLESFALIHSTALPDTDEAKAKRLAGIEKIQTKGIHTFVDDLIPALFAPTNVAQHEQLTKEIGYQTSISGAIAALQAMKDRPDRSNVLEQTKLPVLLLAGENDGVVPPSRVFTTTKRKNIKQVVLPNVGHMSMYEAPQLFIDEITKFLDEQH